MKSNYLPFFTIVTISYNQASFIAEAIESIIGQDFEDYEYIVWDGCSSDGSCEIINSYAYHPKIRTIIQKDNGPADALKKAFSLARGKYYIYINSDDTLLPSALTAMHKAINLHTDSVICGSALFTDSYSRQLFPIYSDRFIAAFAVFGQCLIVQPSTIIPSSLYIGTAGFNPQNHCNWDHELLLDLYENGAKFVVTSDLWSTYRLHQNSITASKKLSKLHKIYRHSSVRRFFPLLTRGKIVYSISYLTFWLLAKFVYPSKTLLSLRRKIFSLTKKFNS